MTAYALGIYRIRDTSWRPAYRKAKDKILARYHGRYLVRSDGAWEVLEGKASSATAFTVLEFPSMEIARAWHSDPDYAAFIELSRQHSELDLILVRGSACKIGEASKMAASWYGGPPLPCHS